jgi:hypothetical protein
MFVVFKTIDIGIALIEVFYTSGTMYHIGIIFAIIFFAGLTAVPF